MLISISEEALVVENGLTPSSFKYRYSPDHGKGLIWANQG